MFNKAALWAEIIMVALNLLSGEVQRRLHWLQHRAQRTITGSTPAADRDKNIVIIGASFAGSFATPILANGLAPKSRYRVIVIEPNSHFQFSWLLPRFCVAQGHEHKAFIPYNGWGKGSPDGVLKWVKGYVASISQTHVTLHDGEEIPYEYLVIATGSGVEQGLPSRVNATDKAEGVRRLQEMQKGVKAAERIVVIGGGAAGVEVATDTKDLYPDKSVTIVHSRSALMHRFGKDLQDEAMEGMKRLGVEVILDERVVAEDALSGRVELRSGRVIECDKFDLSPKTISSSGHIRVKPTLQVADDLLPNVYACGDVADANVPTPNARAAARQAMIVSDNILQSLRGKEPTFHYKYAWPIDSFIKLTLGLHRSTTYIGNGEQSVLFRSTKDKIDLMSNMAWNEFGAKAFRDETWEDSQNV